MCALESVDMEKVPLEIGRLENIEEVVALGCCITLWPNHLQSTTNPKLLTLQLGGNKLTELSYLIVRTST